MPITLMEALRALAKARGLENPDKVLARQPEVVARPIRPWWTK